MCLRPECQQWEGQLTLNGDRSRAAKRPNRVIRFCGQVTVKPIFRQ